MAVTESPKSDDGLEPFPFLLTDADEHSTPRWGAHAEYMDPAKKDLAVTTVRKEDGSFERLYAGKPAKLPPEELPGDVLRRSAGRRRRARFGR